MEKINNKIKEKENKEIFKNAADDVAKRVIKVELPSLNISEKQLQKKFKHAIDFRIKENFNKINVKLFKEAIINYVNSATDIFKSTYRGQYVYVYLKDGLGVYTDLSGNFISV
ncbi:colicin D domain-containing protein [Defluviitalea phaphyphila]|uniref:colicin D domain-containing protein n=1 Tax=Defluviitalea phaphyphila TaxID=1473580 RepID=UPI0007302D10|nr:colicin D domain-containing protein [Defluviitalea phaphyphila]